MRHEIYETLQQIYGYQGLCDGQEPIIESILEGKDVLSVMPTGAAYIIDERSSRNLKSNWCSCRILKQFSLAAEICIDFRQRKARGI